MTPDGSPFVFGTCVVCEVGLERPRRGRKLRTLCGERECRAEFAGYSVRRAAVRRRSEPGPTERKCPGPCGRTLPVGPEHFAAHGRLPDGSPKYVGRCKDCRNADARARYARDREYAERKRAQTAARVEAERLRAAQDPAFAAGLRAQRAEQRRRWRRENPELARAARKRHHDRVQADPARRLAALETRRITTRLRAEQEGRTVRARRHERERDERPMPTLPARPLAEALLRLLPGGHGEVAAAVGMNARTLYAWKSGERDLVAFDDADTILLRAELLPFDVWEDPDVLALWDVDPASVV